MAMGMLCLKLQLSKTNMEKMFSCANLKIHGVMENGKEIGLMILIVGLRKLKIKFNLKKEMMEYSG